LISNNVAISSRAAREISDAAIEVLKEEKIGGKEFNH
jgi:hypothetical protein